MGELITFPVKREPKVVEDIYRREFGYVICPHKIYLPNQLCSLCAEKAKVELDEVLFGAAAISTERYERIITPIQQIPTSKKKTGLINWLKQLFATGRSIFIRS